MGVDLSKIIVIYFETKFLYVHRASDETYYHWLLIYSPQKNMLLNPLRIDSNKYIVQFTNLIFHFT